MGMAVRDVMSVAVRTVRPETTLKDIARLFVTGGISGAPVLDGHRLVGIVTRSDILPRNEHGTGHRTAADVMTREVVTLTETMTVAHAARTMHVRGVRRAPVLRDGRVVGMITESDLLRPYLRTDDELLAEIEAGVLVGTLGISPRSIAVLVLDGVASLEGPVADQRQRSLINRLTASVPGVISVTDRMRIGSDAGEE